MRGLLITFEGPEGSGKSTQVDLLRDRLSAVYLREPGSTPLGEQVRDLLLHGQDIVPEAELYLFLAARAELVATRVKPAMSRGEDVVIDRYHDSTLAYQGARGLSTGWPESFPRPDLTVLLDLEPQLGASRLGGRARDRIESAPSDFHLRVRQEYLRLAQADAGRWLVLDATRPASELALAIWVELGQARVRLGRD
ncbi:MAG TPA: dTMP kinase [Candidatus Nitrosotalea sp.]|nr:dTMP kinase [Candidatus Nitrosotalea sp.]